MLPNMSLQRTERTMHFAIDAAIPCCALPLAAAEAVAFGFDGTA